MKLSIIAAGIASLLPLVSAQTAAVLNNCTFPVYVQSVPYDGSASGPLTTLQPGTQFSEAYRPSGSSVKMGTSALLSAPLIFGYSTGSNPNNAYYELSNQFGNPFGNYYVDLAPTRSGCREFDCAPRAGSTCYSTPPNSKKVYACPRPTRLLATLCAAS